MPADDPVRDLALAALDADAQARALLTPGAAGARIAFSDLYRYATNPDFELPPAMQARLASDPAAAADLERLLATRPIAYMPRQAAAATSGAVRRETDAAVLTLTPSQAAPDQTYLLIELADPDARSPVQLFARTADGGWTRIPLPAFANARAQVLLDTNGEAVAALSDPETEVYLL